MRKNRVASGSSSAVQSPPPTSRILPLDGIRAIAFASIFVYHACGFPPGAWGVSVFLVLSGFAMATSYWDRQLPSTVRDALSFAMRRLKRLLPLHVLMLLLGAIWLALKGDGLFSIGTKLLITIPLLQTWSPFGFQAINSVDWYLSICLFLYAVFPFIFPKIRAIRSAREAMLAAAAIVCCQLAASLIVQWVAPAHVRWFAYCFPPIRLGDFLVGCLIAVIAKNGTAPSQKKLSILEPASLVLCAVSCLAHPFLGQEMMWLRASCLFIPSSALLIYTYARSHGQIAGLLSSQPLLWVASISPYAFLIHRLVLYWVRPALERTLSLEGASLVICTCIISAACTVAGSLAYMRWLEHSGWASRGSRETRAAAPTPR